MTVSSEKTAEAFWTLYQTMPNEVQNDLKKRIIRAGSRSGERVDFQQLATKGWSEKQRTYSREELYD